MNDQSLFAKIVPLEQIPCPRRLPLAQGTAEPQAPREEEHRFRLLPRALVPHTSSHPLPLLQPALFAGMGGATAE